jgi:hypothetical protein
MDLFWGQVAWIVVVLGTLAAIWYFKVYRKRDRNDVR